MYLKFDTRNKDLGSVEARNTYSISSGMRFFRNFPDLRGHSHGNPRSGLIFMGGGGVGSGYHTLCEPPNY